MQEVLYVRSARPDGRSPRAARGTRPWRAAALGALAGITIATGAACAASSDGASPAPSVTAAALVRAEGTTVTSALDPFAACLVAHGVALPVPPGGDPGTTAAPDRSADPVTAAAVRACRAAAAPGTTAAAAPDRTVTTTAPPSTTRPRPSAPPSTVPGAGPPPAGGMPPGGMPPGGMPNMAQLQAWIACMQKNGAPLPQPGQGPPTPPNPSDPAFQKADQACASLRPPGMPSPPAG